MSNSFSALDCLVSWCDFVRIVRKQGNFLLQCSFGDRTVYQAWKDRSGALPFAYSEQLDFLGGVTVTINIVSFFKSVTSPYKWHVSNRNESLTDAIRK